jgi:hypothetical protein
MQYISVADWTNVEVPLAADTQVQLDGLFFCYHSFPFFVGDTAWAYLSGCWFGT